MSFFPATFFYLFICFFFKFKFKFCLVLPYSSGHVRNTFDYACLRKENVKNKNYQYKN